MAVILAPYDLQKFYCLSTDLKPVAGIPEGSELQELNTGARFIWSGSSWVEDLSVIYAVNLGMKG